MNLTTVSTEISFSSALVHLKKQGFAARKEWTACGMFVFIVGGEPLREQIAAASGIRITEDETFPVCDTVYLKTADGKLCPWQPTQQDILADDWVAVLPDEIDE